MAEDDSSEKNEKATPHKLREAAKKGMAAKSQDVNSLLMMSAGLLLMLAVGESLIFSALDLCKEIFLKAGNLDYQIGSLIQWSGYVFGESISLLAMYVAPLMVVAIMASMLQTGPMFTFFPLKPDIQKINPVKGFKRIFSVKMLVELVKSILKIGLMGLVVYFTVIEYLPVYFGLSARPPSSYVPAFIEVGSVLIFRLLLVIALIALIDLIYSRWDHQKQLRMSKKELKDEHKRFDGDPQIRQKRKELARELLEKAKSLSSVSDADVIITNPTHYAVGLRYDRATMVAPKTISKGAGPLAAKIRELAYQHQVPIFENPPLARRLYKSTKPGSFIGESEYFEVAAILRKVFATRAEKRRSSRAAL